MKYIVIGEPCVDLIHKTDGNIIRSYGGILYSIISLAVLSKKGDIVIPIMNLGEDEYENITKILKQYSNINTEGVYRVSHPTRKVNLYYTLYKSGQSARMETSTLPTYSLTFDDIYSLSSGFTDADGILINMISGVDISLDTMLKIRSEYNGYIHIDIHNLVMKTNPDGTREHTTLRNWKKWCRNADTVQMNEFEVKSLSKAKKNEYEIIDELLIHPEKQKETSNISNDTVLREPKGIIITKGKSGVSGYQKKIKKFGREQFSDLDRYDIYAIENPDFKDTTGCGDVFAASFMLDYSQSKEFVRSLHFANRIASYNTSLEGIEELYKLK